MKTNSSVLLQQQIAFLEEKRENDIEAIKQQLQVTSEKLKPSNLVKHAIKDVAGDQQVRSVFKKALIGMVINVGLSVLFANRTLLKSAGALVVTAVAAKLKKRKDRKRLVKKESLLIDGAKG
jgi:hypothetical protein